MKRLCIGIVLSCLSLMVFAQEYNISRTVFLPAIYHVGDRVELRLGLRSNLLDEIHPPQHVPHADWGIIHDIRIIRRDDEADIRILFTSYYPGTQTMPPIDIGPIALNDISIFVTSLLDRTELVSDIGQVILPGTQIVIVTAVLGMFALIFLFLPLVRWCWRHVPKLLARYRAGVPYRAVKRNLKELTTNAGLIDGRNFYIKLLSLVRDYLQGRIQIDAKSATTGELEKSLNKSLPNPGDRNFIIRLFHHGDLVKFASQPSTLKSRMNHIEQLQEVLDHIESGYNKNDSATEQVGV